MTKAANEVDTEDYPTDERTARWMARVRELEAELATLRKVAAQAAQLTKWDHRFMTFARLVATWSKDPTTQVGCVLVSGRRIISTGYNGLPRGCDDGVASRFERPGKYLWTEHAERNAIFNAASGGVSTANSMAYCTMFPCADCARALVQSSVYRIVAPAPNLACERWGHSSTVALEILREGFCEFVPYSDPTRDTIPSPPPEPDLEPAVGDAVVADASASRRPGCRGADCKHAVPTVWGEDRMCGRRKSGCQFEPVDGGVE